MKENNDDNINNDNYDINNDINNDNIINFNKREQDSTEIKINQVIKNGNMNDLRTINDKVVKANPKQIISFIIQCRVKK